MTRPSGEPLVEGRSDQLRAHVRQERVRLALLVELRDDTELRAPLTGADPVRDDLVRAARCLLDSIGVVDPDGSAQDLVGTVDALLLHRVGAVAAVDPTAVLTAYVAGLPRR